MFALVHVLCATGLTFGGGVGVGVWQEEQDDPVLYATRVRAAMAKAGQLTLSDLTLADKRQYHALTKAQADDPEAKKSN